MNIIRFRTTLLKVYIETFAQKGYKYMFSNIDGSRSIDTKLDCYRTWTRDLIFNDQKECKNGSALVVNLD